MRSAKEILDQIPFLKSYRGYEDMLLCMELVAENEERLVRVRERVYLPVAQQKQESLHKVEKNLRTFRKVFFINGGPEDVATCRERHMEAAPYPRELTAPLAQ